MTESKDTSPTHPASRGSALALGATMLLASTLFQQGLGVITLVVTARFLTPEDFGIVAYFFVVTMFLEMFQMQVTAPLNRLAEVTQEHLETFFTMQLILAIIGGLVIWLSLPLTNWMGLPELHQLGLPLIFYSLLLPFNSPRFRMFERELQFKPAAIFETLSRVSYAIAVVILVWWWRDFWAIIVATFVSKIVAFAWSFWTAPMALRLTLAKRRSSLTFTGWAMGAETIGTLYYYIPQILIGPALGLAEAGVFRLGARINLMVTSQLMSPVMRVFYPGLADASRKTDRQQQVFMKMNATVLAIIVPISIGAALVAEDIIRLALGEKWLPAALVIWVLAPVKALETLQENVRSAVYVEGSTFLLFSRNMVLLLVTTLFVMIGVRYGFSGAIISTALSSLFSLGITLSLAKRFSNQGFFAPLVVGWRSYLSTAAMSAAILAIDPLFQAIGANPHVAFILAAKIAVASVIYPTVHLVLWHLSGRPDSLERFLYARLRNFR